MAALPSFVARSKIARFSRTRYNATPSGRKFSHSRSLFDRRIFGPPFHIIQRISGSGNVGDSLAIRHRYFDRAALPLVYFGVPIGKREASSPVMVRGWEINDPP